MRCQVGERNRNCDSDANIFCLSVCSADDLLDFFKIEISVKLKEIPSSFSFTGSGSGKLVLVFKLFVSFDICSSSQYDCASIENKG